MAVLFSLKLYKYFSYSENDSRFDIKKNIYLVRFLFSTVSSSPQKTIVVVSLLSLQFQMIIIIIRFRYSHHSMYKIFTTNF